MRKLQLLLLLPAILATSLLFAQNDEPHPTVFLSPADTIFLSLRGGEKTFTHTIQAGQSLYAIAKFYGLSLKELYDYNPGFRNRSYEAGEQLVIPIPNRAIIRYWRPDLVWYKYTPVCYVVRKGDTVFGIAKRLFQMPIDTIMRRNNLTDYNIELGQPIHIGWMSTSGIPDSLHHRHRGPLWDQSYAMERQFNETALEKPIQFERGPARWPKPQKGAASNNGLYALHNKAPKGSIISIYDPMSKREVYVKVLGRIPKTYDPATIVVVSPAVVKMFGALDDKFVVEVRYLK